MASRAVEQLLAGLLNDKQGLVNDEQGLLNDEH